MTVDNVDDRNMFSSHTLTPVKLSGSMSLKVLNG